MSTRIADLKTNDVKVGRELVLLASNITRGQFKNDKKPKDAFYWKIDFQDITGIVSGNMWEVPSNLFYLEEKCKNEHGVYVAVSCSVSTYNEKLQLTITNLEELDVRDINASDFLPVAFRDRTTLVTKFKSIVSQIADPEYRSLVITTFSDQELFDKYSRGIGGIKMHHNYIGGLLEHTIQIALLAIYSATDTFMFPELDKDLLIVGAIFHDIGKIEEYLYDKSFCMNEDEVEHRYGGISLLDMIIYKNNISISRDKVKKIKNIIMSHHGEFGDKNIRFETPEAIVIHACDLLSSHVNGNLKNAGLLNIPFNERNVSN